MGSRRDARPADARGGDRADPAAARRRHAGHRHRPRRADTRASPPAAGGARELTFETSWRRRRTRDDALNGFLPETFTQVVYMRDWPRPPDYAAILAEDEGGRPAVFQSWRQCFGFAGHPGHQARHDRRPDHGIRGGAGGRARRSSKNCGAAARASRTSWCRS